MKRIFRFVLLVFFGAVSLQAQTPSRPAYPPPIPLWSGAAPGAKGHGWPDKPYLYAFVPWVRSTDAAIMIIPGGGYGGVAMGYEGFEIAQWLNQQGMAAFVLDYRVKPYHYPIEIDDGRRAMRYLRAHAAEFGINPQRLGVWGFSAGGHLASSLGTHCGPGSASTTADSQATLTVAADAIDALDCRPDFMVLSYPVITMLPPLAEPGTRLNLLGPQVDPVLEHEYSNELAVTSDTPPTFIFATTNDPTVKIENSLDFYRALERAHVPAELHIYDYANHGCGLCGSIPSVSTWPLLLRNWMIRHGWLPQDAPAMPLPKPNGPMEPPGLQSGPAPN